jgi:fatty acid desaturase
MTERGSMYAQLARQVRAAGLLERRPAYYATRISLTVLAYAAAWTAVVLIGASWWVLVIAPVMAVTFTQLAFRGRRANDLLGIAAGNLGVGLSYGWWVDKHNRHHAHPNQLEHDPDIEAGALVFAGADMLTRRGPVRAWTRFQAYFFFPLLLLGGLSLHIAGVRALIERTTASSRHRGLEAGLLMVNVGGFFTVLFVLLSPWQAVTFIAVQQGLFGFYMGCSFAPNHKGMPILAAGDRSDFLHRQVLTSRNVDGGQFVDGLLGGLNHQIEHHLFPSMPRPNLRRAQPLIRRFCSDHDIAYAQTTLVDSYRQALRHLHETGRLR